MIVRSFVRLTEMLSALTERRVVLLVLCRYHDPQLTCRNASDTAATTGNAEDKWVWLTAPGNYALKKHASQTREGSTIPNCEGRRTRRGLTRVDKGSSSAFVSYRLERQPAVSSNHGQMTVIVVNETPAR